MSLTERTKKTQKIFRQVNFDQILNYTPYRYRRRYSNLKCPKDIMLNSIKIDKPKAKSLQKYFFHEATLKKSEFCLNMEEFLADKDFTFGEGPIKENEINPKIDDSNYSSFKNEDWIDFNNLEEHESIQETSKKSSIQELQFLLDQQTFQSKIEKSKEIQLKSGKRTSCNSDRQRQKGDEKQQNNQLDISGKAKFKKTPKLGKIKGNQQKPKHQRLLMRFKKA